jgi:hypothetical protein
MATYGDLDPNAMPDMYHKEYVEPVSGQGLISSLFAGPATPTNKVVPNEITLGRTLAPTGISISAREPVDLNTGDILSQITAQSDIGDKGVIGADVFEDPNAMNPFANRFNLPAGDLKADMSAPDPVDTGTSLSNLRNRGSEILGMSDPNLSPAAKAINVIPQTADYLFDAGANLLGKGAQGINYLLSPQSGTGREDRDKQIDDAVKTIQNLTEGKVIGGEQSEEGKTLGKNLQDIFNQATDRGLPRVKEIGSQAYQTIEDMVNDFRNRNIDFAGIPTQPASPVVDATDATNPVSPNMSTGPSMRLNEMTVANPGAIPILPDQAPGEGRAGTDSIINSLGLLEMSEAERSARIARLPEDIRDAVSERITDMMQSASVGDDIY